MAWLMMCRHALRLHLQWFFAQIRSLFVYCVFPLLVSLTKAEAGREDRGRTLDIWNIVRHPQHIFSRALRWPKLYIGVLLKSSDGQNG